MRYLSYRIEQAFGKEDAQALLRDVNYYMVVYLRKFKGRIEYAKKAVLW